MKLISTLLRVGAALACAAALLPATAQAAPAAKSTPLTAEQAARLGTAANAPLGVAAFHRDKLGLECQACHGKKIAPDDNETVENKACVSCHGDYTKLAEISRAKAKNKDINAHGSHLGPEIACTGCHQGHQESKAYCSHCHTNFVMPMPGNTPAKR